VFRPTDVAEPSVVEHELAGEDRNRTTKSRSVSREAAPLRERVV
jgi:hypothetical protein